MADFTARWVSFAYDPREDLGVFCLRCNVHLDTVPDKLEVRVSADQRYKLFVGRELVSFGPQRGDLEHWFYETVDLAPHLKPGDNLVWALVWNFGWMAPIAQMTLRTAFLCDCASPEALNTPGSWEIARVPNWDFQMLHTAGGEFFSAVGPGEVWTGSPVADFLDLPNNSQLTWIKPHDVRGAASRGAIYEPYWSLVPRSIPSMRYQARERRPFLRRGFVGDGPDAAPTDLTVAPQKIEVCSGKPVLLDYQELLCAYPRLEVSGPAGSEIVLTYAEACWGHDEHDPKGNRNEVKNKEMQGYQDKIVLGAAPAVFEPLWWRTFRYLRIESTSPVQVGVEAIQTGYPYQVESSFTADDPAAEKLWEVSVRTAERCAGETFFDCPYYEQLQYAGDTRIQALISYYLGRDRALARNAVEQFGWSILDNGLTQSRYPNRITQVIPPFSLWWLLMRYDAMLYDEGFEAVLGSSAASDTVADGFRAIQFGERRGEPGFWNFVDWVPSWRDGVPPGGSWSTIHRVAFQMAMRAHLSTLEKDYAPRVSMPSDEGRKRTKGGLLAGTRTEAGAASEHAEALHRVLQSMSGQKPDPWPTEALKEAGAAKTTYYFSYYKHLAMQPEDYLAQLGPWKEMIEDGLSTFAENPPPVRSDCHAWSAHPALGFFQLIAGVTSTGPGWSSARIAPRPGSLKRFDARIAHPKGELRVTWEDGKVSIDTPVPAEFVWWGKTEMLEPGEHVA